MTSHIKAPPARLVNVFTGKKAPEKYFEALSGADDMVRELDTLRESQTRVQELEAENARLEDDLVAARETAEVWKQRALAKTEDWHGKAAGAP